MKIVKVRIIPFIKDMGNTIKKCSETKVFLHGSWHYFDEERSWH
jgi:hypothetical protein